jgi:hypothetical protein
MMSASMVETVFSSMIKGNQSLRDSQSIRPGWCWGGKFVQCAGLEGGECIDGKRWRWMVRQREEGKMKPHSWE